jgi:hypothetical protein
MGELKKPSAMKPAACGFALVCMLVLMAADRKNTSDIREVLRVLTLFAFTGCAIWIWIRYLKEYVNFAIEQKLRESNKRPED